MRKRIQTVACSFSNDCEELRMIDALRPLHSLPHDTLGSHRRISLIVKAGRVAVR